MPTERWFKNGDRVRLTRNVERYPHFTARKGMSGTVVFATTRPEIGPTTSLSLTVKIDQKIRGAEEWGNEIEWSYDDDPRKDLELISKVGSRRPSPSERARPRKLRESSGGFKIPGWAFGWNESFGADAAVRSLPKKNGRERILVMTKSGYDRAPDNDSDPVDLGLYELSDDDYWELIHGVEIFDTPEKAVRAVTLDPEWR